MNRSPMQQAIADAFETTQDNLMIMARAGSGKTTTLRMLADLIPSGKSALFMAFNKAIADELAARLPSRVKASTSHSIGFSEIRQRQRGCKVEQNKVRQIIDAKYSVSWETKKALADLVSTAKNMGYGSIVYNNATGVGGSSQLSCEETMRQFIEDTIAHFDLVLPDDFPMVAAPAMLLTILNESNSSMSTIDFDDMIYLPVFHNLFMTKYEYLFVDEAQDLSPLQHHFVLNCGRRLVFVGDDRQAIYAFRGADSDSMEKLRDRTGAKVLPLSVSYRCPRTVIHLAQEIVPDIQHTDDAAEGSHAQLVYEDFLSLATSGKVDPASLVLCRNNKPLFNIALQLLRARIPFKISTNFSEVLIKRVKKFKATTVQQLKVRIKSWADKEIAEAESKNQFGRIQRTEELRDILFDFCEEATREGQTDADYVTHLVERVVAGKSGISLSSIHKSKGLEAKDVYLIYPGLLPSKYATTPAQIQQEMNLKYVAITRAQENLYYVGG